MELTPRTLRDVEFREKLRGYHPDDVDDFLEEAALAVDSLLARVAVAEAAPARGPSAVVPASVGTATVGVAAGPATAGGGGPLAGGGPVAGGGPGGGLPGADGELAGSDATLRRTLLLAQRTADLAIAEARETARLIVERARADADRSGASVRADAVAATEVARAGVADSIAELERRRALLEGEVSALQSWVAHQRDRLREALADQVRTFDGWLATSGPPTVGRGAPEAGRQMAPASVKPGARGDLGPAPARPAVTAGPPGRGRWGGPASLGTGARRMPDPPAVTPRPSPRLGAPPSLAPAPAISRAATTPHAGVILPPDRVRRTAVVPRGGMALPTDTASPDTVVRPTPVPAVPAMATSTAPPIASTSRPSRRLAEQLLATPLSTPTSTGEQGPDLPSEQDEDQSPGDHGLDSAPRPESPTPGSRLFRRR